LVVISLSTAAGSLGREREGSLEVIFWKKVPSGPGCIVFYLAIGYLISRFPVQGVTLEGDKVPLLVETRSGTTLALFTCETITSSSFNGPMQFFPRERLKSKKPNCLFMFFLGKKRAIFSFLRSFHLSNIKP
jgi:hypothetical protein